MVWLNSYKRRLLIFKPDGKVLRLSRNERNFMELVVQDILRQQDTKICQALSKFERSQCSFDPILRVNLTEYPPPVQVVVYDELGQKEAELHEENFYLFDNGDNIVVCIRMPGGHVNYVESIMVETGDWEWDGKGVEDSDEDETASERE